MIRGEANGKQRQPEGDQKEMLSRGAAFESGPGGVVVNHSWVNLKVVDSNLTRTTMSSTEDELGVNSYSVVWLRPILTLVVKA